MKRKILISTILIFAMLFNLCIASFGAVFPDIYYDKAPEGAISNLMIMNNNKLPDGTEINPDEQCMYIKGGFKEGGLHVADRTFTISNITDTELLGADLIGWAFETYKDNTPVHAYYKTNHNVDNAPGLLNWINFTVNYDADIFIYTSREKGIQPDNDRALEEAGFTFVEKSSTGFMKSTVNIANNIYYGKWKKTVTRGQKVSLPSNRSGSSEGRITPVAVIKYKEFTGSVYDLEILDGNKLPDGTAINPSEHCLYIKGGFGEKAQHVAGRPFTLSGISDTDLVGSDVIGWGHDSYKEDTPVRKYYKTNHNLNGTPGILNWINFKLTFDADIYVYTFSEKGVHPDNDKALEASGFSYVGKNANGYMKSSVAINNNIYYGKWIKSVKAGQKVSLPSNRSGSSQGTIVPVAVIKYNIGTTDWPEESANGRDMPFMPSDKYVSQQNPPAFTWKNISDARSYSLEISTDSAFRNVVKTYSGINHNYFNPPDTLTSGETYWWRVRYINGSGISDWSNPRRFRIDTQNYEFTFPGIDEVMTRIPQGHPRILTTPDSIDDFRALKDTGGISKKIADNYINLANSYVREYAKGESGMYSLKEPVFNDPGEDLSYLGKYRNEAQRLTEHMYRTAFAYLVTGDAKYSKLAKEMLLSLSTWCMKDDGNGNLVYDPNGHSSYENQDQVHRYITYRSAMAYDWIYDTLTQEERKIILNMIEQRTKRMEYLLSSLDNSPYDSHGWTALGFIGIIGIATYGELEGAEGCLRKIIPAYTSIIPPWGYQDGGWSQGTDYWQYSTVDGQEFMDVLVQAGIIDLYKTAWIQNEYLWSLYAYPPGSYGSFGDQSNRNKASHYNIQSLTNEVYYNQNPVAKWLVEAYGGTTANNIDNYYTANIDSIESKEPTDYPKGHEFHDIGWAVMTDDLMDENRIQLTFKSSPFGSFNHSHPDQNAFVIQAFGENLANKSGYYDWYHSTHDNHITRPTFSHNTITVDGGKGQRDDDFTAKGSLEQFVTHTAFDSVTGDATDAYKGTSSISAANYYKGIGDLDKFVRDIIYVRPGVFVVIDDLVAADGGKSSFEWWLNAEHEIEYTNTTALIKENNARLSANVVYPTNVKARYYDGFYSPYTDSYFPDTYYPAAAGYVGANEQRKVCFYTPKVTDTKIVATMSVYKDSEEAHVINTMYSADGSYLTLIFADGTKCVVNLGDDTDTVSDGVVTFTGDAVTYNNTSIMLTNGTNLSYNGVNLIYSQRPVTVVMGEGYLNFSVNDDSNDYTENSLTVANNTKFLRVSDLNALKDLQGRGPSEETGLPATLVNDEEIVLYPFKGNYSLYSEGSYITSESLKPTELAITDISDEGFNVIWDEKEDTEYDIIINNTIYEGVASPYYVTVDPDEKAYSIALRGKVGTVLSPWSEGVYYSPEGMSSISHVKFDLTDGKISAEVFAINPGMDNIDLYLAGYGPGGELVQIDSVKLNDKTTQLSLSYNADCTYKAFLWKNNVIPVKSGADYSTSSTELKFLLADGKPIEASDENEDVYTVNVVEGSTTYPVITAVAMDNSSRVKVKNNYADLYSEITVTAQNGETRTIVVNYVYQNGNVHVVTGAVNETDFKDDTGRSKNNGVRDGKVSNANVATLTWEIHKNGAVTPMSANLPVYTNLHPAYSDTTFGSRLASDRDPAGGNYTEFSSPAKGLWGFDHIAMPNNDLFSLQGTNAGGSVNNVKLNFGLSAPAEVIILTTDNTSTRNLMESQGFEFDVMQPVSRGRYMDAIGVEDIYYNVKLLNKNYSDLVTYSLTSTSGSRFKNYSHAYEWVDVQAIEGCTTVQSYIDGGYSKEDFVILGTCESYIAKNTYLYDATYLKRYEDITKPEEITIDFGSFPKDANRMLVVVRPIGPQTPLSNFKYTGPKNFEDLDSTYTKGSTDNVSERISYKGAYALSPVITAFENGAFAYADNNGYIIKNIDPMLELDGAYLIPPLSGVVNTAEGNSWMKAYYYGLSENNGFKYPGFAKGSMPMYSFRLESSADVYVITSGFKPEFIDSTWMRIDLEKSAFTVSDNRFKYDTMFVKHVNVEEGNPVNVSMLTPGTGKGNDGLYYTIVKFSNK